MSRLVTIDPVTRIEGHSKITIRLDAEGRVEDARLHITQFRGFEKFTEGRLFHEMPSVTARTCGICPISHLRAAAKACEAVGRQPECKGELTCVDWSITLNSYSRTH